MSFLKWVQRFFRFTPFLVLKFNHMKLKRATLFYEIRCDGFLLEYKSKGLLKYINMLLGNSFSLEMPFNSILYSRIYTWPFGRLDLYLHSHKLGLKKLKVKRLRPIILMNKKLCIQIKREIDQMIRYNLEGRNLMLMDVDPKEVLKFYDIILSEKGIKKAEKGKEICKEQSSSAFDKYKYVISMQ